MNEIKIESYVYNNAPLTLKKDIAELLDIVWSSTDEPTNKSDVPVSHRAELSAQSFYCYFDNILIGYAAVVHKQILHMDNSFMIAGLSCVATHPDYRGCGIGQKIVAAATKYIETNTAIDFGIFTCHPDLTKFYKKTGDWNVATNVVLLESLNDGALSSETLDVVVLMRLFSEKAQQNKESFCKEPINLNFPKGEFI